MQDMKLQDMKMTDKQATGLENYKKSIDFPTLKTFRMLCNLQFLHCEAIVYSFAFLAFDHRVGHANMCALN